MDEARASELLNAERARIERALAELGRGSRGEPADHEDDPADIGTDLYQNSFDEGLAEDLRRQLDAVERAEARLAAHTYGISVESGEPIPDERLEAIPTAERTAAEEARRR